MKLFLWQGIKKVSFNYHSGGSVLVCAETIERARELCVLSSGELMDVEGAPDMSCQTDLQIENVWIFPNAGCC